MPTRHLRSAGWPRRIAVTGLVVVVAEACCHFGPTAQPPSNRPFESPPAGAAPGLLLALDAKTGKTSWETTVPLGAVSAPSVVDGTIVVQGGFDCRGPSAVIAAFRASDGIATWQSATVTDQGLKSSSPCGIASAPVAMPGVVAASANVSGYPVPTEIRGLDPATGHELWRASALDAVGSGGPLLLLVGNPSGGLLLRAVDPRTGVKRWQAGLNFVTYPLAATVNVALATTSYGATPALSAVDLATGNVLWQHHLGQGDQVRDMAVSDAAVLAINPAIPAGSGPVQPPPSVPPAQSVIGLDLGTGQLLWRHDGIQSANPVGLITAVDGTVFVEVDTSTGSGACANAIEAVDSMTGRTRWVKNGIPTCSNFGLGFAADASRSVFAFSTESGTEVVAVDTRSGAAIWSRQFQKPAMCDVSPVWCRAGLARVTVAGDSVYVALSGQFIAPTSPPG
jgi:outer membrane protein assembly factor BamB